MFVDVESTNFDLHYDSRVYSDRVQYITIDGPSLVLQLAGASRHASERTPSILGYRRRRRLRLPDGLRLIVWPVLALEEWDLARPMARMVISPPQSQPMQPDIPNWTWHEYGMRVGFWRIKRMLDALKIGPTVTLNARVCETYPAVVRACIEAGWELNAHGYDQVPMHKLEDQKAVIEKSVAIIAKFWGKAPRGWARV
jgi:hypothetical protein